MIWQQEHAMRVQLEKAIRERDEARKYAEQRNDEANKLQRFLNMAAQERDEAQACLAFERVTVAELRAEVEKLRTERAHYRHLANLIFQAEEGEELRHVAERQREACARAIVQAKPSASAETQSVLETARFVVRATPLVTEGDK